MKLRTKLIPIFTAASTAAVVAPLTLTSCGEWVRYTDLLHREYQSWIKPHSEITVYSTDAMVQLYTAKAMVNTDIIRDDILWSFSKVLHNTETKNFIDQQIQYSAFDFDVVFTTREVFEEGEWLTVYCADFETHVAGEVQSTATSESLKTSMVDENNKPISSFDLHFNTTIYGLNEIVYFDTTDYPKLQDVFNCCMQLGFDGLSKASAVETITSGSYTTEEGKKEITDVVEILTPSETNIGLHYGWFGATVLSLLTYSSPTASLTKGGTEPKFTFGSHYLQNAKIVD